ncbi:MAG: EamA family transporter [Pseudomonadota bacterium]
MGALAVSGLFLSVSQILMIEGFRLVEASVLSTIKYSSVVFAAALGYWFWGELFDLPSLVGTILIVLSGVVIVYFRNKPSSTSVEILPRESR